MAKQSTFLAWLVRLSLIKRWALMLCFRKENVSEHSHQTAVIAHLLTIIKNKHYGGKLNPEKAATIALYHEVSETKLQDLNSKTKYINPEFTRQYKKLEALAEKECLDTLPCELQDDFKEYILSDEVDPEYRKLVKAADTLAAYIKARDELRFHNEEFIEVRNGFEEKLKKLRQEMPEVGYFMDTFIECCWASVDQLAGIDRKV